MAVSQEMEDLVVEIMGNASQYLQSLTEATARTESAGGKISDSISDATNTVSQKLTQAGNTVNVYAQQLNIAASQTRKMSDAQKESEVTVSSLTERMNRFGKSLREVGQNAADSGEALGRLTGGLEIWQSFQEFSAQEKSAISLKAALEANGREVEELTALYDEFAQSIEDSTTHEADEVVELLKLAEGMDITGDSAKRAVKNALALADAQGKQAASVLAATVALEQGSAKGVTSYFKGLRSIENESAKVVEAQRLLSNMFGVVGAITDTTSGRLQQLNNAWGNFKEAIGEVVARGLEPAIAFLKEIVDIFNNLPGWVKTSIAVILTLTATLGVMAVAIGTGTMAFSALSASIGTYITRMGVATALSYAFKAVLAGTVIVVLHEIAMGALGATDAIEKLNKALEESQGLNQRWAKRFSSDTQDMLKNFDRIKNRVERKTTIGVDLENAKRELTGYTNAVKQVEEEFDEVNHRMNRWLAGSAVDAKSKELEDHKKRLELARDRVEALTRAYADLKDVEIDPKILEAIQKLNEEFELQVNTIGMSSDEIAIYKIRLMGATDEMLRTTVAAERMKRAIMDSFNVGNAAETLRKAISDKIVDISIDFSGLSEFDKQIRKLDNDISQMKDRVKKITIDVDFDDVQTNNRVRQLERIIDHIKTGNPIFEDITTDQAQAELEKLRVKIEEVNKARQHSKQLQDQIAKAEGYKILAENELKLLKLEERKNQILSKGMEITKQLRTPFEQYTEQVQELRTLLSAGAITEDVFNKAIQNATKSLDDAESSLRGVRQELEKLNAVSFKSIEASERVAKFRDTIKEQVQEYNRTKDRVVPPQMLTPENFPIEKRAIDRVREFMEQQKKLDERKIPFTPQPTAPQSFVPRPDANPVARADNTLMQDRADMIRILNSIDRHLDVIEDKPSVVLPVANINT